QDWHHRSDLSVTGYLRYHPILTTWLAITSLGVICWLVIQPIGRPARPYRSAAPCHPAAADAPGPAAAPPHPALPSRPPDEPAAPPCSVMLVSARTYTGHFVASVSGTSTAPITLCGSRAAVIDGGSMRSGYGVYLDGASWWKLVGFTVQDAQKGVVTDHASHN